VSNEKQLGIAMMQYVQDNDEMFPSGYVPNLLSGSDLFGIGWAGSIYTYVKSTGAYVCPDDATQSQPKANPPMYEVSYAMNTHIVNSYLTPAYNNPQGPLGHLAGFAAPSQTVLLCEVSGNLAAVTLPNEGLSNNPPAGHVSVVTNGSGGVGACLGLSNSSSRSPYDATALLATGPIDGSNSGTDGTTGRHTDGSNYVLVDGHAKYIRGGYVSCGGNAAYNATDQPNRYNNAAGTAFGGNSNYPAYAATFSPN
jgi:prepilin-type processing-associated H-X9-DG protein